MGGFLSWLWPQHGNGISSWERTPDVLTKLTIEDLYGLDVSGIADLSRSEAMAISAVAKIRNRITAKIGGFPLQAMNGIQPYSYSPKWVDNLEPGRARFVSMAWIVDSLIFYGSAYLQVTERSSSSNAPQYFRFVPIWKAKTDSDGKLVEAFGQPVKPGEWLRIDAHHEGLLKYGQEVLKRAALIENAASRAAENPVPSIELHQTSGHPMDDVAIDMLVARWAAARNGKHGGVAYTNSSIETKTHGQAAEQLLIAGRNLAAIDVARSMGAPAWSIDATVSGSSVTYGNVAARSRELVEDTLQPYMDAITGRLSLDDVLPRGVWLKIDPANLLREDYSQRMTGHKAAFDIGLYDTEDIRKIENGIPLEMSSKRNA